MPCYLYIITGPTDRIYVGITKNPKERWRDHRKSKRDHLLYRAMKLHGRDKFSMHVVSEHPNTEEAKAAEISMIAMLNTRDPAVGYNLTGGGDYDTIDASRALKTKLETDARFAKAYSLRSTRTVRAVWAQRSPEEKQRIFGAISATLKKRNAEDPAFYQAARNNMLAVRARGDVAARAKAASQGIKQFWIEIRKDPIAYADYIDRRRQTLKITNRAKREMKP